MKLRCSRRYQAADPMIRIQAEDFDVSAEIAQLCAGRSDLGAVVSFTGLVRGNPDAGLTAITLEHYPGMTERALQKLADEAQARFDVRDLVIIHRIGRLSLGANIVLVIAASPHRARAFEAAEFLMDRLKTDVPLWKAEERGDVRDWVAMKDSDIERAKRWQKMDGQ
jgi:molybdopterin synthase catalytic subunit